ncbi:MULTISPECIES: hypothetical protein [unclassified Nocardioides]|uniref:hypothetical protein n=1 Tax=unclassified Nocardioides TaxID=2615069 RepID=UPI0012E34F37|nr:MULTISPECIES: hypothetical protein [unclassified Nocardioides]
MSKGFGSDLYRNMQKVRANGKDGVVFPVKANGKDGIVFGDPPLEVFGKTPAEKPKRPGVIARLRAALSSR